jgi:hypothetical protein
MSIIKNEIIEISTEEKTELSNIIQNIIGLIKNDITNS